MKSFSTSTFKTESLLALFFLLVALSCDSNSQKRIIPTANPFMVVLGTAQDAGYPQAGQIAEWNLIKERKARPKNAVALALVDPVLKQRWLFEATPDFKFQLQMLDDISETSQYPFDGIFLTHAHIGHYTGLMNLGREAMGTSAVPVYAMPKMQEFLTQNGPWSQLVSLNNINLKPLNNEVGINLNPNIKVTPFLVPHRDEFSETVGYSIEINGKSLVFIPDIDKWTKWDKDILEVIKAADYAFLDASFYKNGEIPGRDMNEIPHPFVEESMSLFESLSEADKAKVHFIHFNHTNPLLFDNSPEYKEVKEKGFNVAYEGQIIEFK